MSIAFVLTAAAALSQAEVEAEFQKCIDEVTNFSDYEYGQCTYQRIARADVRLNERWKQLMEIVGRDSEQGQLLIGEERAWIGFKEAACHHYTVEPAGTLDRFIMFPACKLEIVEDRVVELESLIEYFEGPGEE